MSRKQSFRKRKPVEWSESELKELKQTSDPLGKWYVDNLTKNDYLIMMRCFKSLALESGDEEKAKFYGDFLDRFGTTHDPRPKDWKIFDSLMKRIPRDLKGN